MHFVELYRCVNRHPAGTTCFLCVLPSAGTNNILPEKESPAVQMFSRKKTPNWKPLVICSQSLHSNMWSIERFAFQAFDLLSHPKAERRGRLAARTNDDDDCKYSFHSPIPQSVPRTTGAYLLIKESTEQICAPAKPGIECANIFIDCSPVGVGPKSPEGPNSLRMVWPMDWGSLRIALLRN